ncbi:hypothetical protein [Turicibacter sanguinis]|uniref:hypothetical protein n=1 Tax=Turicibacter sanguinis TaxID=154288 RepID=UPI0018992CE4|nr:hypothetical protein [Turicibacter sanguinis]
MNNEDLEKALKDLDEKTQTEAISIICEAYTSIANELTKSIRNYTKQVEKTKPTLKNDQLLLVDKYIGKVEFIGTLEEIIDYTCARKEIGGCTGQTLSEFRRTIMHTEYIIIENEI